MAYHRSTYKGITYTSALYTSASGDIITHYKDNRHSATNCFFSQGVVTVGHTDIFEWRVIPFAMKTKLPDGVYETINHRPESPAYEICVKDGYVVFHISPETWGAQYRSFVWDFEVFVDLSGDVNNDGNVDGHDLNMLLSDWGTETAQSDLNNDGTVGPEDLNILLAHWEN
tara:strand:- start:1435 stop:1947 length:513 start_codon:yes stop_codon:yes gene_type:complete